MPPPHPDSDSGPGSEFEDHLWSGMKAEAAETDNAVLQRVRMAIEGYLELGLADMAEEELAALAPALTGHPLILDARLSLLMQTRRWHEAVETGLQGCAAAPGAAAFFIHTAFCLHELGRTGEAHLLLTSGPEALQKESLFHYNIACYLTVLGRPKEAGPSLTRAFHLDPSLRKYARSDRDLESLWPKLSGF